MESATTGKPILQIRDLKTYFYTGERVAKAVDGVNLDLLEGETLGIVGESGSGKSVTAISILRLLPPGGRIVSGQILLDGEDLLAKSDAAMRRIRGRRLCMIPQDPMTSLNPVLSIRDQMTEGLRIEDRVEEGPARDRSVRLLERFRFPDPKVRMGTYPHRISGGMRQRVLGAIALTRGPAVLIADEPTTSLDATLQLEYLKLLKSIQAETRISIIFITHDFGVVDQMCDRVAVMYAGRIVEVAETSSLMSASAHPYSSGLLASVPSALEKVDVLPMIDGEPPSVDNLPVGCTFAPRCPLVFDRCLEEYPPEFTVAPGHVARCWKLE